MSAKHEVSTDEPIVVIGLGRFGGTLAEALHRLGHEVLGLDEDLEIVQQYADRLNHVAQADSTDEEALRQLGVADFRRAVVGIGTDIEASVLTVVALRELGVTDIWAKAISVKHAKVLTAVGAKHVIRPEAEMGERTAHLITSKMIDFIEFEDHFSIAKTRAPREAVGKTLAQVGLRSRYNVTVVGVKRRGEDFTYARPETVVPADALLIVAGKTQDVERFAAVT
ncbi:potassium channel family protein [Allorhizocola rhizosphaerae]|uniref:potassium channel family protein n=1 Tax=Allorhizocola rhizosphaerae TaxID=1872709 RepID=UPI000E3E3EE8|nr:TrkA family potassium uptake protein [Allorhizocola rhizosphaerae]